MFSPSILRDPGLNIAHWNLPQRHVSYTGDTWYANGVRLRLYHFSGFDPDQPGRAQQAPRPRPEDRSVGNEGTGASV